MRALLAAALLLAAPPAFAAPGVSVLGNTVQITATPTVSATTYTAGADIGGLVALPHLSRGQYSGLVQAVSLLVKSGASGVFDVVFFDSAPAGTITDGAALALSDADAAKVAGIVHVSDCSKLAVSTEDFCQAGAQALPFHLAGGSTGYAVIVARSSVTLGGASDVVLTVSAIQD